MTTLTILAILAAIASMAYVFGGLRRLEESTGRLEERAGERPQEALPDPKPQHPLARNGADAPGKENAP